MTRLKDLRAYIDALDALGEIQRVTAEVDLNLEVGAIIRRSYELRAPAPLFERIREIEPGFRILGAPAGLSRRKGFELCRVALSLGLRPDATGTEIVEAICAARGAPGIKPRVVPSAACQTSRFEEVDLSRLPAPLLHGGDGGRYLNTFGCIVARTPDGSWTNWSIARIMVVDRTRMSGIVAPGQHVGMIHGMWKDIGRDMPFALALGVEPVIPFGCGMPIPARVDEADFLGALVGEPLDVVRCVSNDLLVPASAEIVVEGVLSKDETASEGSMGEYAGYNWAGVSTPKPVYHVHAVTHRPDPILPVVVAGEPVEEDHTAWGIPNAGEDLFLLRKAGLPVTMCWLTLEAANHWLVVTLPKNWREKSGIRESGAMCQRIGEVLFAEHGGSGIVKVLVMEDDVDATNPMEVLWAFATRAHPGSSEHVFENRPTGALAVYVSDQEKRTMTSTKGVYDCLTRDEWTHGNQPSRTNLARGYPQAIAERVLNGWHDLYGYPET